MRFNIVPLILALTLAVPVRAQLQPDGPSARQAPAGTAAAAAAYADGEVRKVDKAAGKLTLRHAEIKSLDMPPMTMVFNVRDPSVLDRLKAGDKVRFQAVDEAGKLTVTDIQLVK